MSSRRPHSTGSDKVLRVDAKSPSPRAIAQAAEVIARGGVVVFPTSGLYGLAADARNSTAVNRLFDLKQRPDHMPILVLVRNREGLKGLVKTIPAAAERIMERLWPGGITIVFPARADLAPGLTAGGGKIGIRVAAHPVARALVEEFGSPVTATSANLSGGPGCARIDRLAPRIERDVELILDAGPLSGGVGSTVIDVTGETWHVLREGAVSVRDIAAALG